MHAGNNSAEDRAADAFGASSAEHRGRADTFGAYSEEERAATAPPRRLLLRAARRATELASMSAAEVAFTTAAVMVAPFVRMSLARRGLERTLDAIERLVPPGSMVRGVAVERGAKLVRWAFLGGDGTCLPESLVQLALHRWFGPDVELVIGVRRGERGESATTSVDPRWELRAHAWIEATDRAPGAPPAFEPILRRRLRR